MTAMPLPAILSIPHGGLTTPPELSASLAIDITTIYNECDLWADQLYDFSHKDLGTFVPSNYTAGVLATVTMPIARVLIDANRDPEDLRNPDGPVKTQTSYGQPIYKAELGEVQRQQLLVSHWQPYHQALETAFLNQGKEARLFLDTHNMAQHGPAAYDFPGAARPLICLANFGDARGEAEPQLGWTSCSPMILRKAAAIAEELFADMTLLEPTPNESVPVVALNWPFNGGYILRRYSQATANRPALPGIMIEVNRGLFVGDQKTDTPIQLPNLERIAQVRQRLYQWVTRVIEFF